jgi:hypothetical protein
MAGRDSRLYLNLLKKCLTNWMYGHCEEEVVSPDGVLPPEAAAECAARGLRLMQSRPFDPVARSEGKDWPPTAYTMAGLKRLDNVQWCVEDVLARNIPGDFIETGVWRGGITIFMRAILKAHGVTDRTVWVADSFAGLPPPDPVHYPADAGLDLCKCQELAIPLEEVQANFARFDLLDDQVRFLKGWFRDTLPRAPIQRLAVLRLDGDLYESTMDALTGLYSKLSPGGYVIVDDYGCFEACRKAVHDFRAAQGITAPIVPIDWTGVYWQRAASRSPVRPVALGADRAVVCSN